MRIHRTFTFWLAVYVCSIGGLFCLSAWSSVVWQRNGLAVLFVLFALVQTWRLFRYVNDTNRRLARFLESVRYSDFAIRFSAAKEKGDSFEDVNRQFNEVLEAFRQTRSEKEANLLFINAVIQHLSTGLLAFDAKNNVLLSNQAAFQLLGIYRLHHLHDFPDNHQALYKFVQELTSKGKILYQPEPGRQLSVQGVHMNLRGQDLRLVTLQNIHPELQRKELDAWRNLARVLRHEIMNSITPIVSLVETMRDIVRYDLPDGSPKANEARLDLEEALEVVGARSKGLMEFVEAYRNFTAIPAPRLGDVSAQRLLQQIVHLASALPAAAGVQMRMEVVPEALLLRADAAQLEMVLLNLVKNACEAMQSNREQTKPPQLFLEAGLDGKNQPYIAVQDNGPGISPELMEEIFIPFFTTKVETTGSSGGAGIGLSISRQIVQMHGGDIHVASQPGKGARFVVAF
jgi:signal transduction histidine kinase